MVVTDPNLSDNPVVYASQGFLSLTGYRLEQVLGRNCRFLQGQERVEQSAEKMRQHLRAGEDFTVAVRNIRADGTAFYAQLHVAAVRGADNAVLQYVGVLVEVMSSCYF